MFYTSSPPTGLSISINGGAACATGAGATLTLAATGSAEMRFRNEQGPWSAWEPYATSKTWTLSAGTGVKRVGFQCRDEQCGAESQVASDTIIVPTFADVPCDSSALGYVEVLVGRGITSGCAIGPLRYCPNASVNRAQMAKFLCVAAGKEPLDSATPTFADVPKTNWAYGCIERLADPDSWGGSPPTSGCRMWGTSKYFCPFEPVTREQMAKFLCTATGRQPMPTCSGTFADVPPANQFCRSIERLADPASWGGTPVTSGCACPSGYPAGARCYCPKDNVTRAQMAVFLVRAFGIPL
jgi:hypothetical protein